MIAETLLDCAFQCRQKNRTKILSIALLTFLFHSSACFSGNRNIPVTINDRDSIKAQNFGIQTNTYENVGSLVQNALEMGKLQNEKVLKLPGGRIDLRPDGAVKRKLYISNSTEDDTRPKTKSIGFFPDGFVCQLNCQRCRSFKNVAD